MERTTHRYSFKSEGSFAIVAGSVLVVFWIIISGYLIFSLEWIKLIVGIGLLYLLYRFLRYNVIRSVSFSEDGIIVSSILKHSYKFNYSTVLSVSYKRGNYQFGPVYKLDCLNNKGKKKSFTFKCEEKIFNEDLAIFLRKKGVKKIVKAD